jgi:mannose/fructose/N-acetylgalactosamine-specific phosphotransferase system component IIC
MNYQPSEIVNLILLLALTPIILGTARMFTARWISTIYWAYGFMLAAYITTILEGFVLPDLFNTVEHICYGAAGVAFAVLVVQVSRASLQRESSGS